MRITIQFCGFLLACSSATAALSATDGISDQEDGDQARKSETEHKKEEGRISSKDLNTEQIAMIVAGDPDPRPRWKDEMRVQTHDINVVASWTGPPKCVPNYREDAGAYQPIPGWGILEIGVDVVATNNGGHSTAVMASGGSFIAASDVTYAYAFAIDLAVKAGNSAVEAKLKQEYQEHIQAVYSWAAKENTYFLKAHAKAHGSCVNQKRGWQHVRGRARLVYIGEPNGLALLQNLIEDNALQSQADKMLKRLASP